MKLPKRIFSLPLFVLVSACLCNFHSPSKFERFLNCSCFVSAFSVCLSACHSRSLSYRLFLSYISLSLCVCLSLCVSLSVFVAPLSFCRHSFSLFSYFLFSMYHSDCIRLTFSFSLSLSVSQCSFLASWTRLTWILTNEGGVLHFVAGRELVGNELGGDPEDDLGGSAHICPLRISVQPR